MSEYRFTGPFYNDNEEHVYEGPTYNFTSESVTPPPAEDSKKEKKKGGFFKTVLKTICIALIAGVVGGGAFLGMLYLGHDVLGIGAAKETITEIQKVEPNNNAAMTVNNSIDVSTIAEKCMPSVVSITNKGVQEIRSWFGTYQQEVSGSGSGIIIGENDTELLIVTNYHVVSDSTELSVYFSFEEAEEDEEQNVISAKIKGYDSQKDLAVISVQLSDIPEDVKSQISIATMGDSSKLKVGEQVVAIGNALGYGQSTTTGIVSALNREVSVTGTNGEVITNRLIQTDAAINPGNSGGALINMQGEVIGINSVKLASQEVEGMGYAIPITAVESIIGDLMNKETRDKVDSQKAGYLGIECLSVTSDVAAAYDLPMGCYVKSVVKGSAAEKAGIQAGDVIIKLDGSSIASDTELVEALGYYEAGETVEVVAKTRDSGYEEQTFSVVLGSRKAAGLD
jgi:serine protease Do